MSEIPYTGLWYADPSIGMTVQTTPAWSIHQYATVDNLDRDYCENTTAFWNNWKWS
jgi:hypothetical protein